MATLFTEIFDGYDFSVQKTYQDGGVDVFATVDPDCRQQLDDQWHSAELGANGYGGHRALDTAASPGNIFLQSYARSGATWPRAHRLPLRLVGKIPCRGAWSFDADYSTNRE